MSRNVVWFRKYRPDKHSLTFRTFVVTLTLNTVIPFFHRTLRLMMLYYQTKFRCKPTSCLEDTADIVIFWLYKPSLWPWHWTQWTNFSAWHFNLWCCITVPGLETKCSVVQKISSGQSFTNILNLRCDLTLNAVIQFCYRTLRLMILYHQTKFSCKRTSSFEDRVVAFFKSYFDNKSLLWPWHRKWWTNFFCMTHRLVIIHHHVKSDI